ncbi:MAG: hypothetical protein U1E13_06030 [Methylophilaceae bacterium]|nr:hypothetical protein [Methylophilaceae bacterium]
MIPPKNCSVAGCEKKVTKAGYSLCYEHWLSQKKSETASSEEQNSVSNLLSATQLGERLEISSTKLNKVFAELGWIEAIRKGWVPTIQGKKLHAEQREHHQSGRPFVLWPESILKSRILTNTISELGGKTVSAAKNVKSTSGADSSLSLREKLDKFKPTHRAMDGHWVRSKAEGLIDNWLYMSGIAHAYERLLPVEEELYCDFYIPSGKVYIEYWGIESDPKYRARKEEKKEIYRKYGFNLIELQDDHIQNLDDFLPKMLLKFNVIVD